MDWSSIGHWEYVTGDQRQSYIAETVRFPPSQTIDHQVSDHPLYPQIPPDNPSQSYGQQVSCPPAADPLPVTQPAELTADVDDCVRSIQMACTYVQPSVFVADHEFLALSHPSPLPLATKTYRCDEMIDQAAWPQDRDYLLSPQCEPSFISSADEAQYLAPSANDVCPPVYPTFHPSSSSLAGALGDPSPYVRTSSSSVSKNAKCAQRITREPKRVICQPRLSNRDGYVKEMSSNTHEQPPRPSLSNVYATPTRYNHEASPEQVAQSQVAQVGVSHSLSSF